MQTLDFIESDDDSELALKGAIVLKIGNSLYDGFSSPNPGGNVIQRGGEIGDSPTRGRGYSHGGVAHRIVPN